MGHHRPFRPTPYGLQPREIDGHLELLLRNWNCFGKYTCQTHNFRLIQTYRSVVKNGLQLQAIISKTEKTDQASVKTAF